MDGGPETKWVLTVAVGDGAPAGGKGVQYLIGDFDGESFSSHRPKDTIFWADFGADFYAAQSWSGAPNNRRIWIAWMNNWRYAKVIPTSTWRGALTLPRELALISTPQGIRLVQTPISELQNLRGEHWHWRDETISAVNTDLLKQVTGEPLEIIASFEVTNIPSNEQFGIRLCTGENNHTTIAYTTTNQSLFIDRTQSGLVDFSPSFPGIHSVDLAPLDETIRLHIFVDRSSVELFANGGQVVFTERIFPELADFSIELFAEGGHVRLFSLDAYQLEAVTFSLPISNNRH